MPNYADILNAVYEVLRTFTKDGQELREETELVADLNLDSVKVMELLLNIEDRFDISIPLNILPDVRTVKDLSLQIQKITEESQ
jgi:acyl carrier protein